MVRAQRGGARRGEASGGQAGGGQAAALVLGKGVGLLDPAERERRAVGAPVDGSGSSPDQGGAVPPSRIRPRRITAHSSL